MTQTSCTDVKHRHDPMKAHQRCVMGLKLPQQQKSTKRMLQTLAVNKLEAEGMSRKAAMTVSLQD